MTINGAPVGRELGTYPYRDQLDPTDDGDIEDGSIMLVVATNAPLNSRSLDRLGFRALMGLVALDPMPATVRGITSFLFPPILLFASHASANRQ